MYLKIVFYQDLQLKKVTKYFQNVFKKIVFYQDLQLKKETKYFQHAFKILYLIKI